MTVFYQLPIREQTAAPKFGSRGLAKEGDTHRG